jgi:hypothetical protein
VPLRGCLPLGRGRACCQAQKGSTVDGHGCKLTENMVADDYSALMLAALMIGHHFSISAR